MLHLMIQAGFDMSRPLHGFLFHFCYFCIFNLKENLRKINKKKQEGKLFFYCFTLFLFIYLFICLFIYLFLFINFLLFYIIWFIAIFPVTVLYHNRCACVLVCLACFRVWCACVLESLVCLHARELGVLACLDAYLFACLACLRAYAFI